MTRWGCRWAMRAIESAASWAVRLHEAEAGLVLRQENRPQHEGAAGRVRRVVHAGDPALEGGQLDPPDVRLDQECLHVEDARRGPPGGKCGDPHTLARGSAWRLLGARLGRSRGVPDQLPPRPDPELRVDPSEVGLHRTHRHEEGARDLLVREAVGDERDDALLGRGQLVRFRCVR